MVRRGRRWFTRSPVAWAVTGSLIALVLYILVDAGYGLMQPAHGSKPPHDVAETVVPDVNATGIPDPAALAATVAALSSSTSLASTVAVYPTTTPWPTAFHGATATQAVTTVPLVPISAALATIQALVPASVPARPMVTPTPVDAEQVVALATRALDSFWSAWFDQRGLAAAYRTPALVYFDNRASVVPSPCGADSTVLTWAFYCTANESIYVSAGNIITMAADFNSDLAPTLILAHEWGHHIQHLLALAANRPDAPESTAIELQATCAAGIWGRRLVNEGVLSLETVEDFETSLAADNDLSTVTHGGGSQQETAFATGYLDPDPAACGFRS